MKLNKIMYKEIYIDLGTSLLNAFEKAKSNSGATFMFNDNYCVVTPTTDWRTFERWYLKLKSPYTIKDYRRDKLDIIQKNLKK